MSETLEKPVNTKWKSGVDFPIGDSAKKGSVIQVRYFKDNILRDVKVYFDPNFGKNGCWFTMNNQTFAMPAEIYEWCNTGKHP